MPTGGPPAGTDRWARGPLAAAAAPQRIAPRPPGRDRAAAERVVPEGDAWRVRARARGKTKAMTYVM